MVATTIPQLDPHALAQLLFASPVQPSEHPSKAAIRKAVAAQFRRCHGDLKAVLAAVAQEAGDHPDSYVTRMKWAIRSVSDPRSLTVPRAGVRIWRGDRAGVRMYG